MQTMIYLADPKIKVYQVCSGVSSTSNPEYYLAMIELPWVTSKPPLPTQHESLIIGDFFHPMILNPYKDSYYRDGMGQPR